MENLLPIHDLGQNFLINNILIGAFIKKAMINERPATVRAVAGVIGAIPGSPKIAMKNTSTKSAAIAKRRNLLGLELQKCFRSLMINRSSNST